MPCTHLVLLACSVVIIIVTTTIDITVIIVVFCSGAVKELMYAKGRDAQRGVVLPHVSGRHSLGAY